MLHVPVQRTRYRSGIAAGGPMGPRHKARDDNLAGAAHSSKFPPLSKPILNRFV